MRTDASQRYPRRTDESCLAVVVEKTVAFKFWSLTIWHDDLIWQDVRRRCTSHDAKTALGALYDPQEMLLT